MVQETNWPYEYVESLSLERVAGFWAIRGGQIKARQHRSTVQASRQALHRRGKR